MQIEIILLVLLTIIGSVGLVYLIFLRPKQKKEIRPTVSPKTSEIDANTLVSAENKAQKIVLDAKAESLTIKENAEKESAEIREKALEAEKTAQKRLNEVYTRSKELESKEQDLQSMRHKIKNQRKSVEKIRREQIDKLETISSLTKEEAKQLILSNVERTLTHDIARKIKEAEEKYQSEAGVLSKEILADAMHNASTDYVAEYTISTVKLPDKDMKGRIIGKEGRNIKAFEDITGVNVDFEEDDEIRLSSFDAVRREIARISMEKLIKDGRIHPARIEEIVQKTRQEVDKIILEAGEKLCQTVGVYNLPKDLVSKLGNFKYRTSYGQNMIQHTLEETKMGVKIANEIGANVTITKLACLLHDIGKVVTDKEGNHIELGAEYLKKYNLPEPVIVAVAEHHDDKPSTVEGVIVQIADSISGSRPGARYEDFENFVKRMKNLEESALSFEGVEKAYAISAGREVRVIVKPNDINDVEAVKLSTDIAKKIEAEQTYPGTVKVVVIRETRNVATAS